MVEQIIVYVDDIEHARQQIAPLRRSRRPGTAASGDGEPTHWIVVACPPHLPGSASRWVGHDALDGWRHEWAEQIFAELRALFPADEGQRLTAVLATGELARLTERLIDEHGPARVLDARRTKFGVDLEPVSRDQAPPSAAWKWQIPAALAGLGALLMLGAE